MHLLLFEREGVTQLHTPAKSLFYNTIRTGAKASDTHQMEIDLDVPFTQESWNGRMKACRGIGASLPPEEIAAWEAEHLQLLERIAPESFTIRHYAALAELTKKS